MGHECDCGRDHGAAGEEVKGAEEEVRAVVETPRVLPPAGLFVSTDEADTVVLADFRLPVPAEAGRAKGFLGHMAGDLAAFHGFVTRRPVRVRIYRRGAEGAAWSAQATHEGADDLTPTRIGYRTDPGEELKGPLSYTAQADTCLRAGLVTYQRMLRTVAEALWAAQADSAGRAAGEHREADQPETLPVG